MARKQMTRTRLADRHMTIVGAHEDASELIQTERIHTDGGTQMRAEINPEVVAEYAALYASGTELPPIWLIYDGDRYWLYDGFHRLLAWKQAYESEGLDAPPIRAHIRTGTRRDAVLLAAGANHDHGLRRSNADKRRSVETLLYDEEWRDWSNEAIARACNVSSRMVGTVRNQLVSTQKISESLHRKAADGRTMDTSRIGSNHPRRAQGAPDDPSPPPRPEPTEPVYTEEPQPAPPERTETDEAPHAPESPPAEYDADATERIARLWAIRQRYINARRDLDEYVELTGQYSHRAKARPVMEMLIAGLNTELEPYEVGREEGQNE